MSTTLNQHKNNHSDSLNNPKTKNINPNNNSNKTSNLNHNPQHKQTNPSKISLRNQISKKHQQKKDQQTHHQTLKDKNKDKQNQLLSQKQKDSQLKSISSSFSKKDHNESDCYSQQRSLKRKQTQQFVKDKLNTDKYGSNVNKIHFQNSNNVEIDGINYQKEDKSQKIQYHTNNQISSTSYPNNLAPPRHFHPYTHQYINSSSNINHFNKDLYTQTNTESHKIISARQSPIQNSNNSSHKPFYQTNQQQFYHQNLSNTNQNSNKKSINSMSVTREEFNSTQSAKNTNSSSFYDNYSAFNTITPLNSYNSLQHNNDSSQQTPTHFHFKNNPNTKFLNNEINQNFSSFQSLQNENKNFSKNSNYQSSSQNQNYFNNFNRYQQQNDQNLPYKKSFPINSSSPKMIFEPNSKSNLIIRNLEYGRNIQPVERTKSHTKHYSNADIMLNQRTPQQIQSSQNLNRINFHNHNQPHYLGRQHVNYTQPNSLTSSINQTPQGHTKSNNPYIINLISNINKSTQKVFHLDSIAEKDQFSKVFVRGNQRNNEKSQSVHSNKYIQRQQDLSNKGVKQKINIISDTSKHQFQGPVQYIQVNQNPNFTNLRYIKNQNNYQIDNKPQYTQLESQKIKNGEKYLKVNCHPFLKNQESSEFSFKQTQKMQIKSVNSSFKQNKSETKSLYENTKSKQQSINDLNQCEKQRNFRNNSKPKRQNGIEFSSSKNNLHQINTLLDQNTFNFDKLTPKTKLNSQYQHQSYSLGVYNNNNLNLQEHNLNPNSHHTFNNDTHLTSPDSKQFVRSVNYNNRMYTSQQEYPTQKLTVFSPKQKDLRPVQKNHFIQQDQSENYRENTRHKKSIKKMLVSQSKGLYNKPQILVSLNFKDLLKGQLQQGRPNSRTFLQAITKSHLTKVFCSTFKIGENHNGCDCVPKCYWVDLWLQIINSNIYLKEKSLMKNIDRNKLFNFSGQNIWKNKTNISNGTANNEVMSFTDMNDLSHLSTDEIETFKQIQKDIPRTFSGHPTFKNQKFRDFLREVLVHSYYLDRKLGYVQGMNIITASIIYHSKTTEEALQLVDFIMNVLDYKKIYLNDMKKCRDLAVKTCEIIRINCYDMYTHVVTENQVDLEMFIVGWYFSMLGTFVPLEAMHFVINKFIQKQFGGIMKIIVTFFIFIKDILMQKNDPNQIMQQLSVQSMIDRSAKIDWSELITVSDKLKLSFHKQDL